MPNDDLRAALTPDEMRVTIRRELQRARLAQRSEEAVAIEEAMTNFVVGQFATALERLEAVERLRETSEALKKRLQYEFGDVPGSPLLSALFEEWVAALALKEEPHE